VVLACCIAYNDGELDQYSKQSLIAHIAQRGGGNTDGYLDYLDRFLNSDLFATAVKSPRFVDAETPDNCWFDRELANLFRNVVCEARFVGARGCILILVALASTQPVCVVQYHVSLVSTLLHNCSQLMASQHCRFAARTAIAQPDAVAGGMTSTPGGGGDGTSLDHHAAVIASYKGLIQDQDGEMRALKEELATLKAGGAADVAPSAIAASGEDAGADAAAAAVAAENAALRTQLTQMQPYVEAYTAKEHEVVALEAAVAGMQAELAAAAAAPQGGPGTTDGGTAAAESAAAAREAAGTIATLQGELAKTRAELAAAAQQPTGVCLNVCRDEFVSRERR
jgi:hypothetical protein